MRPEPGFCRVSTGSGGDGRGWGDPQQLRKAVGGWVVLGGVRELVSPRGRAPRGEASGGETDSGCLLEEHSRVQAMERSSQ